MSISDDDSGGRPVTPAAAAAEKRAQAAVTNGQGFDEPTAGDVSDAACVETSPRSSIQPTVTKRRASTSFQDLEESQEQEEKFGQVMHDRLRGLDDFEVTAAMAASQQILARSMTDPSGSLSLRKPSTSTKPTMPHVTMDGTKLIVTLGRHDRFQFDSPCRILMSSPKLKLEHTNVWTTQATCQEPENSVVIDSGGIGQRFVPIPLAHYGTVYTKENAVHVVVGGDVRRSKVHSRHLPYKTSNKFQARIVEDSDDESLNDTMEKSKKLGVLSPKKAMKLIRSMASEPQGGVVYLRGDESLVRYRLKHDERVEIQCGQIVGWTLGVRFEYKSVCCIRFVSAVLGEGTVWVSNPRRGK